MKKRIFQKGIIAGGTIVLLMLPADIMSQSLKRSCIPCYGSSAMTDNTLIVQTAGHNYFTMSSDQEKTIVLQGFLQPLNYAMSDLKPSPPVENLNFIIYPNPASNSLIIKSEADFENPLVIVTDLNGKKIFSKRIPNVSDHEINCETWDNGVYYLTIYSDQVRKQTMRLIILK